MTAEAVEVRCTGDGTGVPTQLLWRDALWMVREAQPEGWPAPAAGCWRVLAGQGPGRPQHQVRLWHDDGGRWWLQEVPA